MSKDFKDVFEKEAKKGELFSREKIQSQLEKDTDSLMALLKKSKTLSEQMGQLKKLEKDDHDRIMEYFQDKKRFSDLFNGFMSSSNYRLNPDDLVELEKKYTSIKMSDGKCDYLLQLANDEDCIYYSAVGEGFIPLIHYFLNQFKDDVGKVKPLIELNLYLGDEPYEGPESLSEMFGEVDESLRPFILENKVNILDPHKLTDEELGNYSEELQEMFRQIRDQD